VTAPARTLIECAATSLPIDHLLNEARALKLTKQTMMVLATIARTIGRLEAQAA